MPYNITFNGVSLPSFLRVTKMETSVLPTVTHNFKQIAGGVGLREAGTSIGEQLVKVEIIIVPTSGKSLKDMSRELAFWLIGNDWNLSTLVFSDESTMTCMAKVNNSVDISDMIYVGTGTIEFIVPSGIFKSSTAVGIVVNTDINITYNGTAPSYPIITWTNNATLTGATLNLTCVETGETVSLTGDFAIGDVIIVDNSLKVVKKNGVVAMSLINLSSSWIKIPKRGTYNITWNRTGTYVCTMDNNWY